MQTPYISVIIATHNRPSDLANCLASLSTQISVSVLFEVIIVDDHSAPDALSEYQRTLSNAGDLRLQFLSLPVNQKGAVFARNLGIRHAQGEVLGFLDDDSIPAANWIATLTHYFLNYPEITAITGRVEAVEQEHPLSAFRQAFYDNRYKKLMQGESTRSIQQRFGLSTPETFYLVDYLAGGNSAVRRSALVEVKGFDPTFPMMHDKELALRLLSQKCICVFAPDLLVKHVHTKSIGDALFKSFYSGRIHYHLKQKHVDHLQSDRVIRPLQPIQVILNARPLLLSLGWKSLLLVFTIIVLEYLHQLGYVIEWGVTRMKRPRLVIENSGDPLSE